MPTSTDGEDSCSSSSTMPKSIWWGFKKTDDGVLLPDSLWKFYNNCTEAAKRAPAHETVGVHSKITKFLAEASGFSMN